MLVVMVILVVHLLPGRGHRVDDIRRVVPHQALEKLIAPSDANLIAPRDVIPFILREGRHGRHAEQEKYA